MKIRKNTQALPKQDRAQTLVLQDAEAIALSALLFLAQDPERIGRFLALTGLEPGDLRAMTGERGFRLAVLDHLSSDERLLSSFAEAEAMSPERVMSARRALGGGEFD